MHMADIYRYNNRKRSDSNDHQIEVGYISILDLCVGSISNRRWYMRVFAIWAEACLKVYNDSIQVWVKRARTVVLPYRLHIDFEYLMSRLKLEKYFQVQQGKCICSLTRHVRYLQVLPHTKCFDQVLPNAVDIKDTSVKSMFWLVSRYCLWYQDISDHPPAVCAT